MRVKGTEQMFTIKKKIRRHPTSKFVKDKLFNYKMVTVTCNNHSKQSATAGSPGT